MNNSHAFKFGTSTTVFLKGKTQANQTNDVGEFFFKTIKQRGFMVKGTQE
jgi:hypothetical protein